MTTDESYNRIISNIEDYAIILLDIQGNIRNWNKGAEKVKGYRADEIIGKNFRIFYSEEDKQNNLPDKIITRALENGKASDEGWRIRKDGSKFWGSIFIHTILSEDNKPSGFIKITRDLTSRKKLEDELIISNRNLELLVKERSFQLQQTENTFQSTLDNMIEGVQIHNFNWEYIYVNKTLEKYSGLAREELIGFTLLEKYPGIENSELFKVLNQCMVNRKADHFETLFVFPDGRETYFELSIQPVPQGIFVLSVDITERRRTDEILQKNIKELSAYKFALDESSIVAITDQKGIIKHVNQNFCKISKYSESELIGQDHRIINSGHHSKEFIKELWTTIAKGKIWKGEIKNRAKDGSYYWVDTTIVPFLNELNKPYQYLAIRSDITERKNAEEKILKVNRLYEFTSNINKSIVHIENREELLSRTCNIAIEIGKFKYVWIALIDENDILKIVNLGGDKEQAKKVLRFEGLDYKNPLFKDLPTVKVMQSGKFAFNNDLQNDPLMGHWKEEFILQDIHSTVAFPITLSKKVIGIIGFFSSTKNFFDDEEIDLLEEAAGDISFALENYEKNKIHQKTEELVVNNEKRFRALIEKSTDMKTLTDRDGKFIYASPSVLTVFGYNEEEYINKPAASFFHPDDAADLLQKRVQILDAPGKSFSYQYRAKHKNGNWIWCEGTITNMLNEPGVNAMVSNFKDVSERRVAEQLRMFNQNNLNALINNTKDLLWSIDNDYKIITYNKPFSEVIKKRLDIDIIAGVNALSLTMNQDQHVQFNSFYARALSGEIFNEILCETEPEESWSEISFYPIRHDGVVVGTACYSRDITKRVAAEREREEMIADIILRNKNFEQFAYIVSHNLRAPVANILGISEILKGELSEEDRLQTQHFLFEAIRNLDEIVKDLNKILQTKREITENKESINFIELVSLIISSIQNLIDKEQAEIISNFSQLEEIVSLKSYMHSIFYNLISNSLKYRRADVNPIIQITSEVVKGKAILTFRDNGRGINLKNYGEQVFGLYKRFHSNVEGKGLGLFMVKTQLEVLGGKISVLSETDEFTEFRIELPL